MDSQTMNDTTLVPNILHLVYLNNHSLPYYIYLNVLTMLHNIHPDMMLFHCIVWPSANDILWGKIQKHLMEQNISSKVVVTEEPIEIWGHKPFNLAHKSDVIRMKSLRQHGGMYFDLDIIILKSVSHLRKFPMIIAGKGHKLYGNSALFTVPYGKFISTWFDAYINVDFSCWGCHSLALPMKIAEEFPDSINVLPGHIFFPIGFGRQESEILFGEPKQSSIVTNIFSEDTLAVHLWANTYHIKSFLQTVNSSYLCYSMSVYAHILRASLRDSTLLSDECGGMMKITGSESNSSGGRISPYFIPYRHTEPPGWVPRRVPILKRFYYFAVAAYDNSDLSFWQCAFAFLTVILVCCFFCCRKGKYLLYVCRMVVVVEVIVLVVAVVVIIIVMVTVVYLFL